MDVPADGGNLLASPWKNTILRKWTLPGLALFGAGLLLWGVTNMAPDLPATLPETGMGGPAEMNRTTHPLDDPSLLAGTFVAGGADALAENGGLGPLGRLSDGAVEMRIGRGQTFYESLAAQGAAHEDIMTLVAACKEFRNLRKVRAGELFLVGVTPDGGLRSLAFDLDLESHVTWIRDGDTYRRVDGTYPVQRRLRGISGEIDNSLYASLQKLEAPLSLAAKMNDILGWELDFSRDLRQGDTFGILYEEVWKQDKLIRTDAILALEIVNRGKVRRAYRFEDDEGRPGYYDPDGGNLQKQLMRAPVNYSRISSSFSYRRFHPVLKRWMPHLGVDYAAPLGTPVRAAGDGSIVKATRKKGNGRYIQIRHTNREYETFYLHLSRFAKGIKVGANVRQGEVIGYVGATGYATGPHLDFRVRRSGQFVNPRKLKLPAAAPVAGNLQERFAALAGMYGNALAELPSGTTAGPVAVPSITLLAPPAWDGPDFAAAYLPDGIRALN